MVATYSQVAQWKKKKSSLHRICNFSEVCYCLKIQRDRQTDRDGESPGQRWRAEQRVEEPGTQQCPLVARPGGRPWILILQRAHAFRAVLPASSCGEVRLGVGHCPALDPTRCPPCHNKGQVSALHSEVSPAPAIPSQLLAGSLLDNLCHRHSGRGRSQMSTAAAQAWGGRRHSEGTWGSI